MEKRQDMEDKKEGEEGKERWAWMDGMVCF